MTETTQQTIRNQLIERFDRLQAARTEYFEWLNEQHRTIEDWFKSRIGAEQQLEFDSDYEKIRHLLNRMANWEPSPTQPAHFYAMKIDDRQLGGITLAALVLIDKMRAANAKD